MSIPRATWWFVTHRCNLACTYCATIEPAQATPDADPDTAWSIVQGIAKVDPDTVILTGGEPLVVPHLQRIISAFNVHGIEPVLVTNGTRYRALELTGLGGISCSVDVPRASPRRADADNDQTYKSGTGYLTLRLAVQQGLQATASIVAGAHNAAQVPGLVRALWADGIRSFVCVQHDAGDRLPPGHLPWRFRRGRTGRLTLVDAAMLSRALVDLYHELPGALLNDSEYLAAMARHGGALDWHCTRAADLVVDTDGTILTCSDYWGPDCARMRVQDPGFSVERWAHAQQADAAHCRGCFWQCTFQAESGTSSR